jgi:AcrR family transcriptional regulator
MIWDSPSAKRSYHHGNLREALVRAALELIAERGPTGFSFAEAARRAGVSAAAPYRHFKDRDALLQEVALQGFTRFSDQLTLAWNDGKPIPIKALEAVGRAYLHFARTEPSHYAAMFEAGVAIGQSPELSREAARAYGVLQAATGLVHAQLPTASRAPQQMMSAHIWALSHGIATLFGRADGTSRPMPVPAEDLLESAILIYLQGLGLGASK